MVDSLSNYPPFFTYKILIGDIKMSLFDIDGFGESEKLEPLKEPEKEVFQENAFEASLVDEVNPLVKVEVINKKFNMGKLLRNLGYEIDYGNIYCPFHDDESTGKPSAKYHSDTDKLYCFSENKMYSAYHALKILYGQDINEIFHSIWSQMSEIDRKEILSKYDSNGNVKLSDKEKSTWDIYREKVLDKFRTKEVNYKQYKNALYKVLMIVTNESK